MEDKPEEKVAVAPALEEIKKNLKTKGLVFGRERVGKLMSKGLLLKVFMASNVQSDLENDLAYYAKIGGVTLSKVGIPNDELGIYCKKPYSISVIGLLK